MNRSLKKKIKTQSGRFGTATKICVEIPLSITMFNNLFVHKMKMPMHNVRNFSVTVHEFSKIIGPDWVRCQTLDTGTQVRISGMVSLNHRPKKTSIYKAHNCGR